MIKLNDGIINCLWSGGLDSTIAMCYFAEQAHIIQPYHVLIRNGGGKDAREREAIDKLYPILKNKYIILKPIRIKHKIGPSDFRNEQLIKFIKDFYKVKSALLGNHIVERDVTQEFKEDCSWEFLEKKIGIPVYDLRRFGYETKEEQFKLGIKLLGKDILELTWSCQLWWKTPCGKCFSCKERDILFEKYGG